MNTGNVRVAYSTDSVDRKVKDLRLEVNLLIELSSEQAISGAHLTVD